MHFDRETKKAQMPRKHIRINYHGQLKMLTVIETPEFMASVRPGVSDAEREASLTDCRPPLKRALVIHGDRAVCARCASVEPCRKTVGARRRPVISECRNARGLLLGMVYAKAKFDNISPQAPRHLAKEKFDVQTTPGS